LKKRYQIDQQRRVQRFRQLVREENPSVQMIFPMAGGGGTSARRSRSPATRGGIGVDELGHEEDVRHLARERHQQHPERRPHRWGERRRLWRSGRAQDANSLDAPATPERIAAKAHYANSTVQLLPHLVETFEPLEIILLLNPAFHSEIPHTQRDFRFLPCAMRGETYGSGNRPSRFAPYPSQRRGGHDQPTRSRSSLRLYDSPDKRERSPSAHRQPVADKADRE